MICYRNKAIRYLSVIVLCLVFMPMQGYAKLNIKTQVVSGHITQVLRDGAVELDGNGTFYYPFREDSKVDLAIGSVVTLAYYLDIRNKPVKKYVKFAPGENSLAPNDAPPKRNKQSIKD